MTLKKASNILFLIAIIAFAVFIFCVIFIKSDADTWRAFAVCMPIAGICFWGGVILRIVDYIRKK